MKYTILTLTVALCLALVSSNPLPENGLDSKTLDRLVMAETDNETALRNKRTIGILRQLFPDISQDVNPESENRVNEAEAESQNNEVRVQFADEPAKETEELTPLSENETEVNEEENRDKRQGTTQSGNFLFDLFRTAISSGSDSWGNNEEKPVIGPTQGMTAAISGPLTRLLLIANRGWANLIEDIVLRVAATSERFVNYKAKVINWLI
ncbi:uncharacterized protein LOC126849360 isoform X3 [Cataglyphis hispanica]|uniref:uncharacterized protein LOC126849360 isoform X3 n=1 Tax=Cataglyphis hispanica TaxID=1086592 RepID=UPI002180598F|nr:uncharacterized protein LOC126849360 isoform X3 [Cataglyphis hispanica]